MKRVYNPKFFSSKPKFRKPMTESEMILFKNAMKAVYNPKIKANEDIFKTLGIKRIAVA